MELAQQGKPVKQLQQTLWTRHLSNHANVNLILAWSIQRVQMFSLNPAYSTSVRPRLDHHQSFFGFLPWWGRELTERQACSWPTHDRDWTMMAFAYGELLSYMRGRGSLGLTQETALSLLMHWSVFQRERGLLSVCAWFYPKESFT